MDKMCDFLGRGHEFFLKMKAVGFTDEMYQRIISSKGNVLAKVLFKAYAEAVKHSFSEIVYDKEIVVNKISESRLIYLCQEQFVAESWSFDERLLSIYGQSSALSGSYKAKILKLEEARTLDSVREFIQNNGVFAGVLGAALLWTFEMASGEEGKWPVNTKVFSLEEKEMPMIPCLTRFRSPDIGWHFRLERVAHQEEILPAGRCFLFFEKISENEKQTHVEEMDNVFDVEFL